jgi:hypothetical protein
MKMLKTMMLGALAATALTGAASATPTYIYLTGSTAYRPSTTQAIEALLNTGYTFAYAAATSSNGEQGANAAIFSGTLKDGGTSVIIKTSWSGSGAGVQTVAGNIQVPFMADSDLTLVNGTNLGGLGTTYDPTASGTSSGLKDLEYPQIAMADVYQGTTPFLGSVTVGGSTTNYATLNDNIVGVVPFVWVSSQDGSAISNMTPQLAQNLFSNGQASLALFTGNNADEGTYVWATGRNPDSGTRLTAVSETGIGATVSIVQYQPRATSTGPAITSSGSTVNFNVIWPTDVVNGINIITGNSGYSSGGQLAAAMGNHTATTPSMNPYQNGGFYVTYLSTGDATTAATAGAHRLAYNGVTLPFSGSYNYTPIIEGQYTFWGYEHLDYTDSLTGVPYNFAQDMITEISGTTATVLYTAMNVSRSSDGGLVYSNNY